MTGDRARGFLPEVQALRALAVALVVAYHVWPERLPGGFIGVDVFFVISGYLITAHLLREYEGSGRISLHRFWARRIRRLLPAAFVVLAVCVAITFFVLPEVVRAETLRQVAGSAAYVLNWMLGFDSVDYLAAGNVPTIVQHYWTLSVEEQFYIAWPLLLVAAAAVVALVVRRRPSGAALFGYTSAGVLALSLGYSIFLTAFNPSFAYFATTTRAWEFAAGGLLATVVARWPGAVSTLRGSTPVRVLALPTVLGVVVIIAASFVLSGSTPFPGYLAALPVVGTLLVILGGEPAGAAGVLTRLRPIQFVGDISYSIYLWHWPIITTLVILAGRRPTALEGVAVVAATVVLAALTKYFVEDPGRRSRLLAGRTLASFAFALSGILVFSAVWGATTFVAAQQATSDQQARQHAITDESGCFGANAMLGQADCPDRFVLHDDVDLNFAANDLAYHDWCLTELNEAWRSCEFGDPDATQTWALVGDSHAASMVEAFDSYFASRGIKIVTYTRLGCSGLNIGTEGQDGSSQAAQDEYACRVWSDRVRAELEARDDISTVVYLNRTSIYTGASRDEQYRLTTDDIVANWRAMLDAGKRVVSIADWPVTAGDSIPVCLSSHVGESAPCSLPRTVALPPDPQRAAITELAGRAGGGVDQIDLTDAFCDDATCYSVIGDVVVYADFNHISGTYSRTLMNYLGPMLVAGGAG